jgi:hypothetical protein
MVSRAALVSAGAFVGSCMGAWIGSRLALGLPVWPW